MRKTALGWAWPWLWPSPCRPGLGRLSAAPGPSASSPYPLCLDAVGRAGDPREGPRGAGRAALSWGLAELNGQPCAHRGGRWGPAPALPARPAVPVLQGLQGAAPPPGGPPPALPGLPCPGPRLRVALGRVSGGGPCLSSWERRPQGLVVESLCVQNGAGVRGIRHQDRALGESGWDRLGGWCVCAGAKAPKARPEPAEAACRVPPSRLAWALSTVGLFPQRVVVSSLARPVGAESSRA